MNFFHPSSPHLDQGKTRKIIICPTIRIFYIVEMERDMKIKEIKLTNF